MASSRRTRGCRLFVAAAGYGKTTALQAAFADGPVAYYTADAMVEWLAGPGTTPLNADRAGIEAAHVVVDDVGELPAPALRQLSRHLTELDDGVAVSLGSRRPLAASVLTALPGRVIEHGPAQLALASDEVARVLRDEHDVVDADVAALVYDLTAGWPALVQFAGDAAARHGADRQTLLDALTEPGTAGATWLSESALAGLPVRPAALLDAVAELDPITASLCLDIATYEAPSPGARIADTLDWLARTGFLVPLPQPSHGPHERAYRVVPVVGAMLGRHRVATAPASAVTARQDRLRTAAAWYGAHGYPLAAARTLRRSGDREGWSTLIHTRADDILAAGGAAELAQAIRCVPTAERSVRLQLVLGDALRMTGRTAEALRAFEPLVARADRTGVWPAALVWRVAMVEYMRCDYPAALRLCDRVTPPEGQGADAAFLEACRASVLARLGRSEDAGTSATHALRLATASGCDRALAAAHIAVAFTSVGARREEHLVEALSTAERAADVVQLARVLVNQVVGLLRQARYSSALDIALQAVRAAELGSPPGLVAVALSNAGEVLLRLGSFDDAALFFERTVLISRRAGLNRAAMGLSGLGEIDRLRGRREQSRTAFEEAVELARETADNQVLVPVLARLTRVLLDGPTGDLPAARRAADEAEAVAPALLLAHAHVARGWVALADGDLALAQQRAEVAVRSARSSRRADALAESLELAGAVDPDRAAARAALQEAESIWRRAGALPAADQMLVLLGHLPGSDTDQRSAAKLAAERLRSWGIRAAAGSTPLPARGVSAPVRVRLLGTFDVLVNGRSVPLTAWRSRQARSLLKILLARRGRPIARTELAELLWPDDDAERTGHRLSVLLSIVRMVLDPTKAWPSDRYIRADMVGISLDIGNISIDVEDLMSDAVHAAQLERCGKIEQAREVLADVDAAYGGDAFSDEPYEDWARGLREEARAVWLRALRRFAELSRTAGDGDQAVASLVRLLAADPYDEPAHHALVEVLVNTGRHGEARRAFARWVHAMRAIGAPSPDRGLLRPSVAVSRR
ncbi:transcriptional activator [Actinoplanes italicus]|uniref:Transcriptional regulator n=1 Tax=Actinoplanes italicus TaxID=113567 RepID=A0A2T0K5M4_9ACTN|nr:BTAD domain-containing putative transcriptional regulator [Actinoplanes italicus]PRX18277.1 transcriptional regulator [Actinoplanes italicus]GIE32683.1 transcriptional activator [Actinoplanes italicus]